MLLAARFNSYIAGLSAFRHDSAPDSDSRSECAAEWLELFVEAVRRSCRHATGYAVHLETISSAWETALTGRQLSDPDVVGTLKSLLENPVVTDDDVSAAALQTLVQANILHPNTDNILHHVAYENPAVLDVLNGLDTYIHTSPRHGHHSGHGPL